MSALFGIRAARTVAAALLLCALLCPFASFAQSRSSGACDPAPARAVSVQGVVESAAAGSTEWRPVRLNDTFCPGDSIRAGPRSRADIALLDQSVLRLNAGSAITVEAPKERSTGVVDLLRGAVHFFSRGPRSLEVKTRFTTAGVRGTEFLVSVEPQRTLLTVFEGTVQAENDLGSLALGDGQSAVAEAGKAPVARAVVRPRDAVQWTLYYPPVGDFRPENFPPGTLEKAPAEVRDARAHAFRAQHLLSVGAVDEARGEIGQSLQLAPGNADALGLQSVMTLVQGDKDGALQLAQAAVSAAPGSATALIARSYAEQAKFDLTAARGSALRATEVEPNNALAWARLAELHSAFGEFDKTMRAARRAAELQPGLSRTQTVLGFAHLTSVNLRPARQAFEQAIALDQADPLPRLGLGLTKIRSGNVNAGSRDIEIAASLDPSNALVRSYLGKAYYEEKRSPLDEREYRMAQQLDPRDPTPWFYDAIAKQTTNRPIEALQDVEKATELNDNRAVYRSRLLLDSDAAARSASLGRIYNELGFGQLALAEGWKSESLDPTNFSAHRFLADTYSALPRHQIARVSELLQSQLLQPVNNTPLQPRMAESNLFLISSGGPGVASFNEFNPLFNRNGLTALASGFAGEQDTLSGEAVVAGIAGKAGFSVGTSSFRTDGFRANNDQHDRISNAFLQYDFTPQTSVQAEYRKRYTEIGDLQQKFFPENIFPLRNTQNLETYRLGARHNFTPGSIVLASYIHQDGHFGTIFDQPGAFTQLDIPQDSDSLELQHLWRRGRFNLRTGAGFAKINGQVNTTIRAVDPVLGLIEAQSVQKTDVRHANAYTYADVRLLPTLTGIVGVSFDKLTGELPGGAQDRTNPKFGLIWNATPSTTVRAAAFKVMKRTLVTNQTLEPTQVAGFNQFFDDGNLTRSRRYGVAVDQKFSTRVFGGVELSKRDLNVLFVDTTADPFNPPARTVDWRESLARGYLFWTPRRSLALGAEYLFERFRRDPDFSGGARELDIHRVPLSVRYFHSSGVSAAVTTTYWYEKGQFEQLTFPPSFLPGRDHFWLVDAAVSFRLPRRHGFISVGARNLFDKAFSAFDVDPANPTVLPRRMAFISATLALP